MKSDNEHDLSSSQILIPLTEKVKFPFKRCVKNFCDKVIQIRNKTNGNLFFHYEFFKKLFCLRLFTRILFKIFLI